MTTVGIAGTARAEDPPAPATAPAGPDLVLLKNGGMLRGTISELVPGETVTIVTAAGKTREIPMSDVSYAGPADKAPTGIETKEPEPREEPETKDQEEAGTDDEDKDDEDEPKPYVTVYAKRAKLQLESKPEGLTFYREAASAEGTGSGSAAGYERLCTAPCKIALPAGTETLAISDADGVPRKARPVTLRPTDTVVRGYFESRSSERTFGWILLAATVGASGYLVYDSFKTEQLCGNSVCVEASSVSAGELAAGLIVLGAGIPVGIYFGVLPDKAHVEVAARPARGVSLTGSF